jgi:hypothetical protein
MPCQLCISIVMALPGVLACRGPGCVAGRERPVTFVGALFGRGVRCPLPFLWRIQRGRRPSNRVLRRRYTPSVLGTAGGELNTVEVSAPRRGKDLDEVRGATRSESGPEGGPHASQR